MRVCIVYDCLYPWTVGGAERWYRNIAERLASQGHDVTYLTLRQWSPESNVEVPGVRVIAVAPRMELYANGRRRLLPPVVFGLGVFWHLLRLGRSYDVVHTASFPYFSVLAVAAVRPVARFRIVIDWHEFWTTDYWIEYLGRPRGIIGAAVQRICLRVPHHPFCFSRLHERRLRAQGIEPTLLEGEYAGVGARLPQPSESVVVFAGRHIPEKGVLALPAALARARIEVPELRAEIYGDGPLRSKLVKEIANHGLSDVATTPGFVPPEQLAAAIQRALCVVLPSRREGYGLVVVEAAALGTPAIVVSGPDNAATELIEDGVNGFVAPSASPDDLGAALVRSYRAGAELRRSTVAWFSQNERRLSLERSVETVLSIYAVGARA